MKADLHITGVKVYLDGKFTPADGGVVGDVYKRQPSWCPPSP